MPWRELFSVVYRVVERGVNFYIAAKGIWHGPILYEFCSSFSIVEFLPILANLKKFGYPYPWWGAPELTIQGGGKNACATYFGHISSTEARIFMKFETYVHKIVLNHQPNFHKDPCKDARARGENARTCDAL